MNKYMIVDDSLVLCPEVLKLIDDKITGDKEAINLFQMCCKTDSESLLTDQTKDACCFDLLLTSYHFISIIYK